jgi:hypothetical protein
MRLACLLVCVLAAPVHGDDRRECHLQDLSLKVTELGCFDQLRATEDHTYGTRVCLIRSQNAVCSGVLYMWDGDPEARAFILDGASCGTKDGPVTFAVTRRDTTTTGTVLTTDLVFTGKLAKRVLRGSFGEGTQARKVAWKRARDGFDARERIVRDTQRVCDRPPSP